jgi:hypothetical protein
VTESRRKMAGQVVCTKFVLKKPDRKNNFGGLRLDWKIIPKQILWKKCVKV